MSNDVPNDSSRCVAAAAALGALASAALVLDRELRVVLATPAAELLLQMRVPIGERAPALLCGGQERPVAEALASGEPVSAVIPHPSFDDARRLSVRSLPLFSGETPAGWLLLLAEAEAADESGVVEFHSMVTADPQMKELFAVLTRVARTEAPVLVRGETGTGKELVASAIHRLSARRSGPFRAINCAALPANLLESELFGHVRGAFTGAVRDTPGHFQLAAGGTLFLDEIGEVPLELQAKLLRAIEAKQITPVGGRTPINIDVRIVSATHRALRREVEQGRFRADLMYRLRVIPVYLPPLRERPGDIEVLVNRIAVELNAQGERQVAVVSPDALALLQRWPFPGNVRELRNVLVYAWAIGTGPVVLPGDLPYEIREGEYEPTAAVVQPLVAAPPTSSRSAEADRIARVLERTDGSRARAARVLGISRVTLWRRMKELGLLDNTSDEP